MRILRILKQREKTVPPPFLGPRVRAFDDICRKSGDFQATSTNAQPKTQKPNHSKNAFIKTPTTSSVNPSWSDDSIIMMRNMIQQNPVIAKLIQVFGLRKAKE